MSPAPRGNAISLTTPLGSDAVLVTGFQGHEELSRLFTFQLDLTIPGATPAAAEDAFRRLIGQTVSVTIPDSTDGGPGRQFSGIVSRFSQSDPVTFRAEVVPWLWFLTRKRDSRTFQDQSVPDIVAGRLAGQTFQLELTGNYEARTYCVQYRESDFDFASRLMEEEGIYYYFSHTSQGHVLHVSDAPTHPQLVAGLTLDLTGKKAPAVFEWTKSQELRSGHVTLWDHNFELPHRHLEAERTIQPSVQVGTATHDLAIAGNGSLELYDYPGGYAKRFDGVGLDGGDESGQLQKIVPDAQRTAALRMEAEAVQSLVVEGGSTCRNLMPGYQFTLLSSSDAAGDYVVTSVDHAVRVKGDVSKPRNLDYTNTFTCIPAGLPYRPARSTARPVIAGPQTAYVVGPAGEEIHTDKYGRVKVQFHWDREGKNDANSSCWVRVGALHQGEEQGPVVVPRVGWEVVVDFLEGDPDQPIVVGSVYNPEHPRPGADQ